MNQGTPVNLKDNEKSLRWKRLVAAISLRGRSDLERLSKKDSLVVDPVDLHAHNQRGVPVPAIA